MMKPCILVALVMIVRVSEVECYNILCYHPLPSKSHDLLAQGLIEPLLQAGHKITWVTPFPAGKPKNVTVIDVSQTIILGQAINMADVRCPALHIAKEFADNVTKAAFSEDVRRTLLEHQYDAVISEWFLSDVDAGFAAVQKVPWILLSGFPMHAHLESLVDTVRTIPTQPTLGNSRPIPLSFWDRLSSLFSHLMMTLNGWVSSVAEEAVYEAFFKPIADARGVALPPYSEARRNVAVLLVNSHPSFSPSQSLPPNVVEIGGFHIKETTSPLPRDIQEILDSSTSGVVYFSLGSIIRSAGLPEEMKRDLIEVLSSIPYTVLWKFEDKVDILPKNVHIRPWMPQSSILAHPNVKLFISHSGLLSTQEALHYGVPILALPFFADQPGNADFVVTAGVAVKVTFGPNMKEEFGQALKEILYNDKYYNKAKYLSRIFRNRPVAPSVLIRHYVELAIETNGAQHLRSTTNLYAWYQICMLDLLVSLLVVSVVTYLVIKKIIICLLLKIKSKENQISNNKKSK